MVKLVSFMLLMILFAGCDPAVRAARVRPDKSIEAQINESQRELADVYLSRDKLVELQIYSSTGIGRPPIHAIIINNRETKIKVDLKHATYSSFDGSERLPITSVWYDECITKPRAPEQCEPDVITILPKSKKRISFYGAAQGEFRLPFTSESGPKDEIRVNFKRCGFFGKCDTIN